MVFILNENNDFNNIVSLMFKIVVILLVDKIIGAKKRDVKEEAPLLHLFVVSTRFHTFADMDKTKHTCRKPLVFIVPLQEKKEEI